MEDTKKAQVNPPNQEVSQIVIPNNVSTMWTGQHNRL